MTYVAWDVSHHEFTVEDHYYFSVLKSIMVERKIVVREIQYLEDLDEFDVLVINYPELKFDEKDVLAIHNFLLGGGRVIILGYYRNEDGVADAVNSITRGYGIELNVDYVYDFVNNDNGDELFVVTSRINHYNNNVKRILMPCSASIRLYGTSPYPIALGEDTARTSSSNRPIIAAGCRVGRGELIVIGTCVFWDNYAIYKYDNSKFAINILSYSRRK